MAKCQSCGCEMTKARSFFFTVCKDCAPSWPGKLEERKKAGAVDKLDSIIKDHLKGETLKDFGIVYWNTAGTVANTVVNKVVGAALLGGIGYRMLGTSHRFGVVLITEKNFHLLELGEYAGDIIPDDILNKIGQVKDTCVHLGELIIEDRTAVSSHYIHIFAPIQLKIFFPTHRDPENKQKLVSNAARIADAINSAKKVASPILPTEIDRVNQMVELLEKGHKSTGPSLSRMTGMVICPACREKVLPKQDGTCPSCQSKIVMAQS